MEDALLGACKWPTWNQQGPAAGFKELADGQLEGLLEKHADAETDTATLASAAMFELVLRGNAKGIKFAEWHLESHDSPHCRPAVYALLRHHELPDLVEYWQPIRDKYDDGFDPDSPVGMFILGGWIHDEYMLGNESSALVEDWGQKEAFESAVPALQNIHPPSGAIYAKIFAILKETDGNPTGAKWDAISALDSEFVDNLEEWMILRHLVRHPDVFRKEFGKDEEESP